MIEAASITFRDADSGDDAVVIIRYDTVSVALSVSLKSDGDIEVRMEKAVAKRLVEALSKAG
jgi:hypothetical protein